jgi:hypothetical protein
MFLVEPEEGLRWQYGSAGALGDAIRRGELGPRARIFHRARRQWLPITVHPEYRKAESSWVESSGGEWRERRWTFLPAHSGDLFHEDGAHPWRIRAVVGEIGVPAPAASRALSEHYARVSRAAIVDLTAQGRRTPLNEFGGELPIQIDNGHVAVSRGPGSRPTDAAGVARKLFGFTARLQQLSERLLAGLRPGPDVRGLG